MSKALGKYVQTSQDVLLYNIDYSQWLGSGETISGTPTFTVETTTSPPLVINNVSVDSLTHTLVAFYASGGVSGTQYNVTVSTNTSAGQTKEDYVVFSIKDPP